MNPIIAYKSYQRRFLQPLQTAHGAWSLREGFIVEIQHEDGVRHYGEVAPIPDFGSETLAAAADFLSWRVQQPDLAVPAELHCCGFALSVADLPAAPQRSYALAGLLPAGERMFALAEQKVAAGFEVLKCKIGVEPLAQELARLQQLLATLPPAVRLRLDANAGLSAEALAGWLAALAPHRERIEYLEQPLSVGQEPAMAAQMQASGIPIALDESLNGAAGAHWLQAWDGPLVVKPALMGPLPQLLPRLQPLASRVVLSSVFETRIGLGNALSLADQLPDLNFALGFDTGAAFDDALNFTHRGPRIEPATYQPQTLWNSLPPLS